VFSSSRSTRVTCSWAPGARSTDPAHDAGFIALRGMFPVEITLDLASVLFPGSALAAAHGGERRYSSVEHAFQAAAPRGWRTSRSRRAARLRGEHRAGASAQEAWRDELLAAEWDAASYRVMGAPSSGAL
jgi:hypothetical protein